MPKRIFITAAEVSGDKHAAMMARSIRQLLPDCVMEGFGGPEMSAAGVNVLHETTTRAAMMIHGIARVREVAALLKRSRRHFNEQKIDLQICVDSSAMNLHFARVAKECGIPV